MSVGARPRASYISREGLEVRMERFFSDNQSEELSYANIVTKFGCSHEHAKNAVCKLKAQGVLETVLLVRRKR